ncbi:MAG: universal stress protein [Acidobacteriaceae bacterium]|nr:universal stress protein [Acidobacteriaceae bacterium]
MTATRAWESGFHRVPQDKPEMIQTIAVPLDGSAASKAALPVARTLAQLFGATVHVLYAGHQALDAQHAVQELGLSTEDIQGVVLDALTGDPAEAIFSATQNLTAPLLVMCTHTAEDTDPLAFGAIPESVLSKGPALILLVSPERGAQEWNIRRVLLAHDGTPTADAAIAPAADIASRAEADVTAVHVASCLVPQSEEEGSLPAPRYIDQPQHEWPAWAGEFLQRMLALGARHEAMHFKLLVTGGQPGSEVAQFARDTGADLVLLAWRGHWQEPRAGTLKVIARRSGCPVLLINTREPMV